MIKAASSSSEFGRVAQNTAKYIKVFFEQLMASDNVGESDGPAAASDNTATTPDITILVPGTPCTAP